MFLTEFTSAGGKSLVSFGGNAPGTIKQIEISEGREFLVQKDAFLVAEDKVDLSVAFQKRLGAAFLEEKDLYWNVYLEKVQYSSMPVAIL